MVAFLLVAALGLSCRIEDAHYRLRTAPSFTARFRDVDSGQDWPSHLALGLHSAKTGQTYWFLPWNGGSDDMQNVASTTDVEAKSWKPPSPDGGPRPLGDFDYIQTDAAYTISDRPPVKNGAAPSHFFISRLGDSLWHQHDPRESLPKQFFDLVSCGKDRSP